MSQIEAFIAQHKAELYDLRRWFHQHPEISYKEFTTSLFIQEYLTKLGVPFKIHASTGVEATIGTSGKIAACRLNMDALPIPEKSNSPHSSLIPGYSHACGHDFELAWGLMVANYFVSNPPQNGQIKLLFQPAEEEPGDDPNGRTGGELYAQLGLFDVDAIFSLHVDPEVELNTVSIIDGDVTCAAYDFEYRLQGKSCHAAKPQQGINPVIHAGELIGELKKLEQRIRKSFTSDDGFLVITPSIISVEIDKDSVAKEDSQNTIPEFAIVKGISRVRSRSAEKKLLTGLKKLGETRNGLVNLTLNLFKRAPATNNDTTLVRYVIESCLEAGFTRISKRTTWRDDAGWGSEKAPTAHGFIGIGKESDLLHSPHFFPNESGLEVGLSIFLNSLTRFLNN